MPVGYPGFAIRELRRTKAMRHVPTGMKGWARYMSVPPMEHTEGQQADNTCIRWRALRRSLAWMVASGRRFRMDTPPPGVLNVSMAASTRLKFSKLQELSRRQALHYMALRQPIH